MATLAVDIGVAVTVFAGTNVDDLFVLVLLFADRNSSAVEVVVGQIVGVAALTAASLLLAFASYSIPLAYVGLLGFVPIALGAKKLADRNPRRTLIGAAPQAVRASNIFAIAGITVANGGDNLAVFVPLFATLTPGTLAVTLAVFGLMTVLWCALASSLVRLPTLGGAMQRIAPPLVPWVFIGLGIYVLARADSLSFLR